MPKAMAIQINWQFTGSADIMHNDNRRKILYKYLFNEQQ